MLPKEPVTSLPSRVTLLEEIDGLGQVVTAAGVAAGFDQSGVGRGRGGLAVGAGVEVLALLQGDGAVAGLAEGVVRAAAEVTARLLDAGGVRVGAAVGDRACLAVAGLLQSDRVAVSGDVAVSGGAVAAVARRGTLGGAELAERVAAQDGVAGVCRGCRLVGYRCP